MRGRPLRFGVRGRLTAVVLIAVLPAASVLGLVVAAPGIAEEAIGRIALAGFVGVVGLASVLTFLFSSRFVLKPLRVLTATAEQLGSGDLSARTDLHRGHDEIGELARSLDAMAASIEGKTTEVTELNERLQQRAAAVEAANAELEGFAYSVSHDLRAPLRAINGFSQILLDDHADELSTEARRLLGKVSANAERMGRLVDELLSFSRLGRQGLTLETLSPRSVVKEAQEQLEADLQGRSIEMTVADDLPPCRADRALLRQVYANLIGNALKFTRDRDPARIEIGWRDDGGTVVYFVADNGAGFDMQYADKLFGVFQRLHPAGQYEGMGVGLATVQRVVHRHGGRVWAEGEVGEGARVFFTIGENGGESS